MNNDYEEIQNPINEVQKKMVNSIGSESFEMPKSKQELKAFVISVLVAVDHEANEKEFMDKCVSKAARTYYTLSQSSGRSVYVSSIKNQMVNTNYFKTLKRMASARGVDVMKLICAKMVRDGYAKMIGGKRIVMTDKAIKFIGDHNEWK